MYSTYARTVSQGGVVNPSWTTWDKTSSTAGNLATFRIEFQGNGQVVDDSNPASTGTGGTEWFTPLVPGVGTRYWVRLTGAFTTNTASSWAAISGEPFATLVRSRPGDGAGTSTVNFTIEIATDAAGSNIVATWSGNVGRAVLT